MVDGENRGAPARLIEFDQPSANDWLAVNQFSVTDLPAGQAGNKRTCRPDVVLVGSRMQEAQEV